jgi:glycine/D-amino acid oxidase-like deaminating enzyme
MSTCNRQVIPRARRRTSPAELNADVVISGGGAAGLFLTYSMSAYGLRVLLIEKSRWLAAGASTRNEGWLHASFHAAAITDREEAMAVARRTCYGHHFIRRFAPEALEDIESRTFALIPDRQATEVRDRWNEADVPHRWVPAASITDPLNTSLLHSRSIFEVPDISIDTRVLYAKLAQAVIRHGATILVGSEIVDFQADRTAVVQETDTCPPRRVLVRAPLFVYAMGPQIKSFFQRVLGTDVPLGFSVSHLLDVEPRLCRHAYYTIERHGPTLMHHHRASILGLAREQTLVDTPSTELIPAKVRTLLDSSRSLVSGILGHRHTPRACVKVFCTRGRERNLLPGFGEPRDGHLWVIPGKMTETPYVAAQVLRQVCWDRFELGRQIRQRPIDEFVLEVTNDRVNTLEERAAG